MIVCIALLLISTVLAGIRFYLGPTSADRVLIFDLLTSLLIGGTVLFAIVQDRREVTSLILVLSILSFVGTSFLAFFLEQKTGRDQ